VAVTIKDIAKVAGVSHTTVSRALRGNPAIAPQTVARIQQIAGELHYVPNTVARGLKTSRSGVLGVIVRRIVDPFFSEVLQGIEDVLHAAGYSLFLAASDRDPDREKAIVRAMSERRVDGVIICSSQVGEEHRQQLERFGVRTVLINNQASEDSAYSVYHDDVAGSRAITGHLLALGHRRISYLGNARAGRTSADRWQGYAEAMAAAGAPILPGYVVQGPNGLPEGGASGAEHFLLLAQRPTAIVCYNDMMAIGAMQALQQAGQRVPADCSITGFDNIELAAYVTPALTTFDQPKYELGQQAAGMMLRLLGEEPGPAVEPAILVLRGKLCVRDSTGPPEL
jgi:DNA-binding LacI/PurR family transcriptional regulator